MRQSSYTRWVFAACAVFFSALSFATTYRLPEPGNDIVGRIYLTRAVSGDTLSSVGLRNGMSLHEMMEANPRIQMNTKLRVGQKIVVPAQFILPKYREGIVVNMAELRLYYFPAGSQYVMTFPVAMGRDQWRTPTVTTKVISKERDPVWNVPESIRAYTLENKGELLPERVMPGPDNPLGHFALHLGENGYLIHGNNDPSSIGKFVSSGCIRMRNQDVETLFTIVPIGTPVHIVHYPYKLGWFNGDLYLEAQVPVELPDDVSDLNATSVGSMIEEELRTHHAVIDWPALKRATQEHLGIPELVGSSTDKVTTNEPMPPLPTQLPEKSDSSNVSASSDIQVEQSSINLNSDWEDKP